MKKYCWFLVVTMVFMCSLSAFACWEKKETATQAKHRPSFEIVATMDTDSNAKNVVWVGTFQLIWNDLIDEIIEKPVEFVGASCSYLKSLNKREFSVDDLKDSSYYKKLGLASYELKKEIEQGIQEKFNEKSDILDRFNWTSEPNKYILYAMLKKDFEYLKPFDKLPDGEFKGVSGKVKYFGIDADSSSALRYTVKVLFYNSSDDFAVSLCSKQGDTVFLYRTNDDKKLSELYDDMISKSYKYMGIRSFGKKDELKVPKLDFKKEREFSELCNRPIKDSDFMISKAIETVQFKMDETGVKLKSEAGIVVGCTCCPSFKDTPRYFYFDDKYVIFLQEKTKPYFGMKVEDPKSLQ